MNTHRISIVALPTFLLAIAVTAPAHAALWQLTVIYTQGEVVEGPMSMGVSELPDSVTATFRLDGPETLPTFHQESIISAALTFGDGTFNAGDLHNFSVIPEFGDSGEIIDFQTVSYRMGGANDGHLNPWLDSVGIDALADPCVSRFQTTFCRIGRNSNFELNLFALDRATDEFVHYRYLTSSQVLERVPEPSTWVLALAAVPAVLLYRSRRRT